MRIPTCILCVVAIIACIVCYSFGFRSGIKQSRLEEDQRGLVVLTLSGYKAAEATNWTKVQSLLSVEILGFTRDYERRFGVPNGTNSFVGRFAEAKVIADRVDKQMVPVVSGLQKALGSNVTVEIGK
jgi:hypothetical protein